MSTALARAPRRQRRSVASSSIFSKLTLLALALIAILCFLPTTVRAEEKENDYGTVIGIDLGTTYSCVAVQKGGKVEIIANDQGNRITPSWVGFTDEERLVGDAAKNQAPQNPSNTVFDAKRLIGRSFTDGDVKKDTAHFPFKIINQGGKPMIQVEHRSELKEFVSGTTGRCSVRVQCPC
jgi:heat shock protein 5